MSMFPCNCECCFNQRHKSLTIAMATTNPGHTLSKEVFEYAHKECSGEYAGEPVDIALMKEHRDMKAQLKKQTSVLSSPTVYIVTMRRWGDDEGHSYIIGSYTDLANACIEGLEHQAFRANKYEPFIQECVINGEKPLVEVTLTTATNYAKLRHPERFDDKGKLKDEKGKE